MVYEYKKPEFLRSILEYIAAYGISPPGTSHFVDVGTDDFISHYRKEIVEDLISKGGATCKFIEGAYGSGKTHLLQILEEVSLQNGMVVASIDLSQALGLSDWKLITKYILVNMEAKIEGQIVKSLPEIVDALGTNIADENIETLKKESLPSTGFKNAIIYTLKRKNLSHYSQDLLKQYLMGNKVSTVVMRNNGLTGIKGNLTQKNAECILKTVLASLYFLGLTGTALLFDENEKTLVNSRRIISKKNKIAANSIRRLIDGCSNGLLIGTVVVFAVLPGFLENCAMNYQALGQRLQIVRGGNQNYAWRCPIIPVHAINSAHEPEDFLLKAAGRYLQIVKVLGGNVDGLKGKLLEKGQSIINNNVGTGYKRELVKVLATISLERL